MKERNDLRIWKIAKEKIMELVNKGAFHVFIGSFITKFVAFFGSIFIVRVLTKQDFGILGYIENLFNYAYVLAGMGLANALLRYVILAKEKEEKYAYYKYVIKYGSIFNIFLFTAVCIFAIFYPHPAEFASAQWLLPILLISLPLRSLCDSQNSMQRAMFDNKKFALWGSLISISAIGGKFFAALLFGLNGAVFSWIFVYGLFAIALAVYLRKSYFDYGLKSAVLTRGEKSIVNSYSIQYMITNSIWTIFMLNDVLLLGQFTGNAAIVADYKVAYVLPANLSLISASIGVFVGPYFVKHENDAIWVRKSYKKVFGITALSIGLAALILYIFAEPITSLLYGSSYLTVVPVMRVLLIAAFINTGLRYTNANLLAAMGYIRHNMFISLAGVLMQVLINVFIIPKYGAMGVAYTSVIVYAFMAIALAVVFKQKIFNTAQVKKHDE